MSEEEKQAITTLRKHGNLVIVWSKDELGNVNTEDMEEDLVRMGNEIIDRQKQQ